MNACSACHGKTFRSILLTLNGIRESLLQWKTYLLKYVKPVTKNIFLQKPLINSKLPLNCIAHIKQYKYLYFNFLKC